MTTATGEKGATGERPKQGDANLDQAGSTSKLVFSLLVFLIRIHHVYHGTMTASSFDLYLSQNN